MDDFVSKPGVPNLYGLVGNEANAIEPGKRMLSSMTPVIVFKDNKPFLAAGSPGGGRIITTVLQTIVNIIEPESGIIFDPATGSAGMFVQRGYFIETKGNSVSEKVTFYGQVTEKMYWCSKPTCRLKMKPRRCQKGG